MIRGIASRLGNRPIPLKETTMSDAAAVMLLLGS
jgi:hypothetical protein